MKNYFAESSYMNSEKFEEEIEILKENYPDADLSRSYTIISANGMFHLGFPKEINPDLQRDIIRRLINPIMIFKLQLTIKIICLNV